MPTRNPNHAAPEGDFTLPSAPTADSLDVEQCFDRLASESVGRIVYSDGALPAITPVRYAVDGREVYFRPGPDPRLAKAIAQAVVAFEADDLQRDTGAGWTVVVTGIAQACSEPKQLARAAALHLLPASDPVNSVFVISPGIIAGQVLAA